MKRVYCFAVIFILCISALCAADAVTLEQAINEAAAAFSSRIKAGSTVVVVGISSDSNELSEFIADELSYKIYSLNKLKVAERKSLDAIKKEMNFQLSGEVSDDTIKQIGNMTGASTVIVGTFKIQRTHYLLTIKALDVSTAIVQAMHRTQVKQSETIINAMANENTKGAKTKMISGARYTHGQRFGIGMKNFFVFGLGSYQAGYKGDGIGLTVTHIVGNSLFWGGLGLMIRDSNLISDYDRQIKHLEDNLPWYGSWSGSAASYETARKEKDDEIKRLKQERDSIMGRMGPIIAMSLGVCVEFGAFLYGCIVPIWYDPQYSKIGAVMKNFKVDFVADNRGAIIPRLSYRIEY